MLIRINAAIPEKRMKSLILQCLCILLNPHLEVSLVLSDAMVGNNCFKQSPPSTFV